MNNLIRLRDGVAEVCRDDPWQLLRELPDALPPGPLLLPLAAWLERRGEAGAAAPWLAPDDEVEALLPHFAELPLIAVDFPSFRDGRGYSLAYLLRVRLGWSGELRAVGDVLRDQAQPYAPVRLRCLRGARGQERRGCAQGAGGLERALRPLGDRAATVVPPTLGIRPRTDADTCRNADLAPLPQRERGAPLSRRPRNWRTAPARRP